MAFFSNSSGFIINGGTFNLHSQSEDAGRFIQVSHVLALLITAVTEVRERDSEGGSCELDAKRDWRSSSISDGLMVQYQ